MSTIAKIPIIAAKRISPGGFNNFNLEIVAVRGSKVKSVADTVAAPAVTIIKFIIKNYI